MGPCLSTWVTGGASLRGTIAGWGELSLKSSASSYTHHTCNDMHTHDRAELIGGESHSPDSNHWWRCGRCCLPVCRTSCPFSLARSPGLTRRTSCHLSLMAAGVTHTHTQKEKNRGSYLDRLQLLTEEIPMKWLYCRSKEHYVPWSLLLTPCRLCACSYWKTLCGTIASPH